MSSYLTSHTSTILKSEWHTIQIQPTATPGIYAMWVLAGESVVKVHVSIPRTYYVNMRVAGQGGVRFLIFILYSRKLKANHSPFISQENKLL